MKKRIKAKEPKPWNVDMDPGMQASGRMAHWGGFYQAGLGPWVKHYQDNPPAGRVARADKTRANPKSLSGKQEWELLTRIKKPRS